MKRAHCPQCMRPVSACYCHLIEPLNNLWPVFILQHSGEARHALGTARIAALGLENCVLKTLTDSAQTSGQTVNQLLSFAPVLIYPGIEAAPVADLQASSPRPLLFIDATWRKSRRLLFETPELAHLPRYALHDMPASRYRIRRSNQPDAVSTLEAVVYTLELLETAPAKYVSLLNAMDWMIAQQISHIGASRLERNYE